MRRSTHNFPIGNLDKAVHKFVRETLIHLMRQTKGRIVEAANLSGRNRTQFYRLLDQHGIDPRHFRGNA